MAQPLTGSAVFPELVNATTARQTALRNGASGAMRATSILYVNDCVGDVDWARHQLKLPTKSKV